MTTDGATPSPNDSPRSARQAEPSFELEQRRRWPAPVRWLIVLALLGGAGYGGWYWWEYRGRAWWRARGAKAAARSTYVVGHGDLAIVVAERGSLKALKSEVIESKVEGKAMIIEIVPEGTLITNEHVAKGRILVRLDAADLSERLVQQQITFANAEAAYTQAKEAYDIQKSQGESNINQAELDVKFGRMDLERYVGEEAAAKALRTEGKLDLLELAKQLHVAAGRHRKSIEAEVRTALAQVERALRQGARQPSSKRGAPGAGEAPAPKGGNPAKPPAPASAGGRGPRPRGAFDERPGDGGVALGGAGRQNRRKLEGDIDLAIEEFKRAADKVIWTARLEREGIVNRYELEADQLAVKRQLINLEQALSALEIFLRYELPKEAEQLLSLYKEAKRELSRVEARGRSALAQKEAERRSKEASYLRYKSKLEKLQKQVGYCTIRATSPGIVVYASSHGRRRWRGPQAPIDVGTTVHERQEIIRLPDMSSLAVSVGVHESVIDRVRLRLPVDIRIDAFPNLRLTGEVSKIGVLPTPKSWWNPDLKEYETDISISGGHAGLKPGMSARVEIKVRALKHVLLVPVQAVSVRGGKRVVYVVSGESEEAREVKLGEANENFVEIRSGLEEGEEILKEAPREALAEETEEEEKQKADRKSEVKPKRPRVKKATPAAKDGAQKPPRPGVRRTRGKRPVRRPKGK